jgi:outer membrane scaffolding protein for murein synthesis (MipA/OmpV family)
MLRGNRTPVPPLKDHSMLSRTLRATPARSPIHWAALALLASAATLGTSAAQAQAFDAVKLFGAAPGQSGGLAGAALIAGHAYMGSDERWNRILPLLDYQWHNGWFAGTTNGVGVDFSNDTSNSYGLRLTADFGRKEDRSDALIGMGDIDPRPEIGGFFNHYVSREIFLTSSLRYGSGNDRKGLIADVGAGYSTQFAPQWRIGVNVATSYVNANYMQSNFGVTAEQAAATGYALTTPGAGFRDLRSSAALTYVVGPRFTMTGVFNVVSLQNDAKSSPLTREKNSVNGVFALSYGF